MSKRIYFAILPALVLGMAYSRPASSEQSTSGGKISVAQLSEMLDRAPGEKTARQVLVAYTSGIGETTGLIADAVKLSCKRPFSLNDDYIRNALLKVPAGSDLQETAATPIVVQDMLRRADCRPARQGQ